MFFKLCHTKINVKIKLQITLIYIAMLKISYSFRTYFFIEKIKIKDYYQLNYQHSFVSLSFVNR